jgi:hypothetical protein
VPHLRLLPRKSLLMSHAPHNLVRTLVLKINYSVTCLNLKKEW